MSEKGQSRRKARAKAPKRNRGGAPIRAKHMITRIVKPAKWKQPKWHKDLFGPDVEDQHD